MVKVFDLDGTLLDSNGVWRWVDETFIGRHGLQLTDEYNEYVAHAIFPDAAKFTRAYYHLTESEEEIMNAWYELAYNAYASELQLKPGALDFLTRCSADGDRMALYTSSEPSLCKAALAHHHLTDFFESLLFAQELKLEKKYPASFRQISHLLKETPGECVLYDDSPLSCSSAKAAGWQVIGVEDPFFSHHRQVLANQCDKVINTFQELL